MPVSRISRDEAIKTCKKAQEEFEEIRYEPAVQRAIGLMGLLGEQIGYTPAFRAIVMGKPAEESIRWKD